QIITSTLSTSQGVHAARIRAGVGWRIGGEASETLAPESDSRSGWAQSCLGFQNRSNKVVAPMEQIEATMSTSHGPCRFEIRNCGNANETPAVKAAGHTPSIPRKPAMAQTTQNGTISEKNGSWRPTICERATS